MRGKKKQKRKKLPALTAREIERLRAKGVIFEEAKPITGPQWKKERAESTARVRAAEAVRKMETELAFSSADFDSEYDGQNHVRRRSFEPDLPLLEAPYSSLPAGELLPGESGFLSPEKMMKLTEKRTRKNAPRSC